MTILRRRLANPNMPRLRISVDAVHVMGTLAGAYRSSIRHQAGAAKYFPLRSPGKCEPRPEGSRSQGSR
jgi:hypothetical protein